MQCIPISTAGLKGKHVNIGRVSRHERNAERSSIAYLSSHCKTNTESEKAKIYQDDVHLHTGKPLRSACNCISRLFVDMDPSTLSFFNRIPKLNSIASKTSLVW